MLSATQRRRPVRDRRALPDRAVDARSRVHRRPRQPAASASSCRTGAPRSASRPPSTRADEIDVDMTAPRMPIDDVPDWALQFCLPSRYCQSDLRRSPAPSRSPSAPCPATRRSRRSGRGSQRDIRYEYNTSSASTSASTPCSRAGVCRDFAHLGIALCRASTSRRAWSSATSTSSTRWTSTPGSRPTSAVAGSRSTPPRPSRGNRVAVGLRPRRHRRRLRHPVRPVGAADIWMAVSATPDARRRDFHKQNRARTIGPNRPGRRWLASTPWIRSPPSTSPARRSGRPCRPSPGRRTCARLFADDPGRAARYLVEVGDLRIDYSKQRVDRRGAGRTAWRSPARPG